MAIIFCLRVEDAHQLMKQLPAGKLRDLIKLKIHDANWNPSPARPRTLIIRDEGDSLPLLAINEDVIQPVDELEIEWP